MNTLGKSITSQFFATQQDYDRLRQLRARRHLDSFSAPHQLLYLALMGKDWRKAFTPITNPIKLANGMQPYGAVRRAVGFVTWLGSTSYAGSHLNTMLEPFEGLVTLEMVRAVAKLLPSSAFNKLPDEAYCVVGGEEGATVVKPVEAV